MEDAMMSKFTPLIVGGLIPAVLYGLAGVFQKWSAREGGSASVYLIGFGVATVMVGVVFRAVLSDGESPVISMGLALIAGLVFAIGAGLISLAVIRFDAAISQLAPLYNMNFLITVLLGLLIFAEFRDVEVPRLLAGGLLILLGGWVVSGA